MKQTLTILSLLSIIFLSSLNIQAQSAAIDPYLQTVLLDAGNQEMIDVYATLKDQYSLDQLREQTALLSKKEKQKEGT